MITESQVLAHIKTLDQVPDPQALDPPAMSSTAFLERQRRHAMSVIEQSKSSSPRWRRGKRGPALAFGAAVVIVLVGLAVWLAGGDDSDTASPSTPIEVVEEHVGLRLSGQTTAALATFSPEQAENERDFYEALGAWNLRGTQVTPCEEVPPRGVRCVVTESNDFLAVAGLSPWTATLTFGVDEDLKITSLAPSVDTFADIAAFSAAFRAWMDTTHPEESARMEGNLPDGSIDADDARIALQYVDEFVAQSERYPLSG